MRITVLGCSGSVVGPDSPASGYLLTAPDTPPLVLDFGGGVMGALQRYADPNEDLVPSEVRQLAEAAQSFYNPHKRKRTDGAENGQQGLPPPPPPPAAGLTLVQHIHISIENIVHNHRFRT